MCAESAPALPLRYRKFPNLQSTSRLGRWRLDRGGGQLWTAMWRMFTLDISMKATLGISSAAIGSETDVTDQHRLLLAMLPALFCMGMVFLITGASLATLPLYIHSELGFGATVVGLVAVAQFVVALISRIWAGRIADVKGSRAAMLTGLGMTLAAGVFYLGSARMSTTPMLALASLLVARMLLGAAESFIITAGQSWGLLLAGRDRAAEVIGWAGIALFVSLALGAPLGSAIYAGAGWQGISLFTLLISLTSIALIWRQSGPALVLQTSQKGPMVLRAVARAGMASGLAGFTYSALAFFSVLLFLDRGWQPTWAPFSVFALALILMRVLFAGLPDRLGPRKTALIFLVVQISGLAALVQGAVLVLALAGSFLAGVGYAFIYPALGREAVQSVAPERVGRALGYCSAFFDLSMGVSGLLLGQVAEQVGLWAVFAVAILASALAASLVATLPKKDSE